LNTFIIAGNVADARAVEDLQSWGADAIKVGIGPGAVCETYRFTGFGTRGAQASALVDCFNASDVPLIIDGGLRNPGDISKSIVLGASFCMVGSMLAGFEESPGNIIRTNEGDFKEFYGSASSVQKGNDTRVEGKRDLVRYKSRSIMTEYTFIQECLQSAISYAGGKKLSSLMDVDYQYSKMIDSV
jgi:GMP reductase